MTAHEAIKSADITKEALEDYEKLVSITGLGSKFAGSDHQPTLNEKFEWGRHHGNLLISNSSRTRPQGRYGMMIAEHWMVFPEEIESSLSEAIFKLTGKNLFTISFTLHTFTELSVTIEYRTANAESIVRGLCESGNMNEAIAEGLRNTNFEGTVNVEYFTSVIQKQE